MDQYSPGKVISFRLPNDTPTHVIKHLNARKKKLERKFSAEIASLFIDAVSKKALNTSDQDSISIQLPKGLTEEQKDWLRNPHTLSMISQMLYQVVQKPLDPFDFNQEPANKEKNSEPFKAHSNIAKFAAKTFDFDDDDD